MVKKVADVILVYIYVTNLTRTFPFLKWFDLKCV